ncbi:hypothetical protein L2E82_33012 [Cichorium intybus]|uniref:Uncharacterized protein n=1 Tax=Cichorium intybus TaxID=13427 RepID=A0ACB9BIW0_CICIN|nr:hypothetical protein L2E82_33012 [Cichorium intybus]
MIKENKRICNLKAATTGKYMKEGKAAVALIQTSLQQCPVAVAAAAAAAAFSQFLPSSSSHSSSRFSVKFAVSCFSASSPVTIVNGNVDMKSAERNEFRLGLPSKGRMAPDTLDLLKDCQLSVRQLNPRQYVADIPQIL